MTSKSSSHIVYALLAVALATPWLEAFSSSQPLSRSVMNLQHHSYQRQQYASVITQRNAHNSNAHRDIESPDSTRRQSLLSLFIGVSIMTSANQPAVSIVTDETETFANTASDSSYRDVTAPSSNSKPLPKSNIPQSQVPASDEITITVPKKDMSDGLGIELGEVQFQTAMRVYVKSIAPGSTAERAGIQKDWVVVSVNGQSVERTNGEGVAIVVYRATKATPDNGVIQFVFRDPALFRQRLRDMATGNDDAVATTQIAPEGSTDTKQEQKKAGVIQVLPDGDLQQSDQRLSVSQLVPPKLCTRGATTGDLLEIAYLGTVVETGATFDGSAIKINGEGIPGRGNDVSLFFVLGKQPMGQFPPGWDVGLEGMCVVSAI